MTRPPIFGRELGTRAVRPIDPFRRAWDRLGHRRAGVRKLAVTVVLLLVIYYSVTTLVAWITAPRIDMTMSPIAGPIAVAAEAAQTAPIERRVTYTGSVAPYEVVTVYPRAEGWVEQFTLYEGDYVREGQAIARLDRTEITATLENAKAGVEQARASLEYWKKELPRLQQLFKSGAMAESDADHAAQEETAARAKVGALEAEVRRLSTVLSYTDVVAPISGRVSKRHIYAGILVRPGMPIVDLQDLSRIRVQVNVADKDLHFVRRGTAAVVRFASEAQRRATVTTIFPELDSVARTARVELVLSNPNEAIRPEMYAVVDFVLERKDKAVVIPMLAVYQAPGQEPVVYVTDGVTAFSRPVKLGIAQGDRVEVVDGVQEGEMVIWKGQRNLTDGAQVNLVTGF